ncbi:MAG: HAF repeat-containing protein [Telluria sp.]
MQMRDCISLFLLSLTMGLAHAAPAAYAEYRVTVVGPANSRPTDINNAGVVVGTYQAGPSATRAFLHRGKGFVDLGTLGGRSSDAQAINDRGEVLGNWVTRGGQRRGYVHANGKQRDIGALPGRPTTWLDINNAGYLLALGGAGKSPGSAPRSFLRDPRGKFQDVGKLPFDKPITQAHKLNNRNQVAGRSGPLVFTDQPWHAIIWQKGTVRDLGDLGSEPHSGLAINDRGQVTGEMSAATGFAHRAAFLYSNGRLVNIDGRPPVDGRFSSGKGINNHGHVVGSSDHLGAFVYRGKRMQGLNALIDPKPGWNIQSPQAINDAGQIAAIAVRKGVRYAVRLDLIRPHALASPHLERDDD